MGKHIRVTVPATTANLGAGFDCLGMALDLRNEFDFELGEEGFSATGEGAEHLQSNGGQLVFRAWRKAFRHKGLPPPAMRLAITNRIPLARGLGSSATAVVAGLYAANALGRLALSPAELLSLAAQMEGHPDNAAPALFGGLVISSQHEGRTDHIALSPRSELQVILAIPDFPLATAKARAALPSSVSHGDAVFNVGRVALFVGAWVNGEWEILGRSMADRLHQPYRAPLVPGFIDVVEAAKNAGALGAALSGAGSAVLALTVAENRIADATKTEAPPAAVAKQRRLSDGDKSPVPDVGSTAGRSQTIGAAMAQAFCVHGITCRIVETTIACHGAVAVGEECDHSQDE